jgi:hypothetical protein
MKKQQTTVNLTCKAQTIKDDLAPIFGLKNILSAGLLLFNKLSSDEQKQLIDNAHDENKSVIEIKPHNLREAIKNIVEKTKAKQDVPAMTIRIEPSDREAWSELEKIAGVETEKKAKKA